MAAIRTGDRSSQLRVTAERLLDTKINLRDGLGAPPEKNIEMLG
jgi:hypothetical protein